MHTTSPMINNCLLIVLKKVYIYKTIYFFTIYVDFYVDDNYNPLYLNETKTNEFSLQTYLKNEKIAVLDKTLEHPFQVITHRQPRAVVTSAGIVKYYTWVCILVLQQ